ERPQRTDTLFSLWREFRKTLAESGVKLLLALVRIGQPGFDETENRRVPRFAELDGAVDIPGHDQFLDLRKELFRIDAIARQLEVETLDHNGQHDGRTAQVQNHERWIVLERRNELVELTSST